MSIIAQPAPDPMPALYLLGAVLCAVAIVYRLVTSRLSTRYPPGPPGKPLVGNILDVEPQGAWTKLTKYKDIYGSHLVHSSVPIGIQRKRYR